MSILYVETDEKQITWRFGDVVLGNYVLSDDGYDDFTEIQVGMVKQATALNKGEPVLITHTNLVAKQEKDAISLLITVFDETEVQLIRCALKIHSGIETNLLHFHSVNADINEETRKYLHCLLPDHVKNRGQIVAIETIFEVAETALIGSEKT